MEAGVDSLGTVEIRNALSTRVAMELTPTTIIDYPTILALSTYLADSKDSLCDTPFVHDIETESIPEFSTQASAPSLTGCVIRLCITNLVGRSPLASAALPLYMRLDSICSGSRWGRWRLYSLHYRHRCRTTNITKWGVDQRLISTSAFGTMGYWRRTKRLHACTRTTFWILCCKRWCLRWRCLFNLHVGSWWLSLLYCIMLRITDVGYLISFDRDPWCFI